MAHVNNTRVKFNATTAIQGTKLVTSDGAAFDHFGRPVAASATDGKGAKSPLEPMEIRNSTGQSSK